MAVLYPDLAKSCVMRRSPQPVKRDPFISGLLRSLTDVVTDRPLLSLLITLALAAGCVVFTVQCMKFKTDRADLIDPNAAFHKRWRSYTQSFGEVSDMVVVVEGNDPDTIKQALKELGSRMESEPELFRNVLYKIEPGRLRNKGLQYVDPGQLEAGLNRLAEYRPILQGRWELITLQSLFSRLKFQLKSRMLESNKTPPGVADDIAPLLHHTNLLASSLNKFLNDSSEFQSPWPDIVQLDRQMRDSASQVIYLLNDAGTLGFLKAFPVQDSQDFDGATQSIERLRQLISKTAARHPEVQIGLTGIPVLEHDEMQQSQNDMIHASAISFVGCGLLLLVGFRGFRHPILALLTLSVAMCWAFGYTTAVVGHLNILSVSFAAILIGLGIDFAIHYLARYLQLRHEGTDLKPALLETSTKVGTGIVAAAVTTSLAFLCASMTSFLGVAELGIIAGGGILLCAAATFVVLPALVKLADRNVEPQQLPTPFQGNVIRILTSRFPVAVILCSVLVIGLVTQKAFIIKDNAVTWNIEYDYNLLNLQADNLESVEIQKRVFREAQDSLLFAVSVADTAEEARELRQRFGSLPTVHHVEELASRLPASPADETKLMVQGFHAELSRIQPVPEGFDGFVDPEVIGTDIDDLYLMLRTISNPVAERANRAINEFLDGFERLSLQRQVAFIHEYQIRMATALYHQFQALEEASDPDPVTLADLPDALTSRFVSSEGKWLLQIFPKKQIWEIGPLTQFVDDVRSVDPEATGTPLQNYEASRQIMDSYQEAAVYALIVICVVLLMDLLSRRHLLVSVLLPAVIVGTAAMALHLRDTSVETWILLVSYVALAVVVTVILDYRGLRDTLLAVSPPLAGGAMMFGILAMLNVPLNPANLIVLPLVLGIGVDDGVHVIHDFRSQRRRYCMSSSTINAIVLTSLTSMIGFGSMMLAAHRGLYSLGLVLVIGVGSCLFVSLVPLPAILNLIARRDGKQDRETRTDSINHETADLTELEAIDAVN